jgi:hypothetical protein
MHAFVSWIALAFHPFWARESRGGPFTYPILYKGGQTWYFRPAVGRYIDWSFIGHFVALALLGLIWYLHRDALVKRVSANTADASSNQAAEAPPGEQPQSTSGADPRTGSQ